MQKASATLSGPPPFIVRMPRQDHASRTVCIGSILHWEGSLITKPLTFADCVGDELPLGHSGCVPLSETTQIENPRTQWRQEQERMLKEYLVVAQEALKAKKEMYLVKQQRLELAQQEMLLFHELSEDNRSITSTLSGSSSNSKYDPDQIKVEIACRRERLSRLKQELAQVKQELQYKEMGVETLQEIDRKMSCSQTNYKLDEAQAIFTELRSIKKSISTGEKERQDLIQCLAKLTVNFQNSSSLPDSASEAANSTGGDPCSLQQYCDTGCQTDIMGEYGSQDSMHLVDKVKLNWQYEEAKKKVQSIQHQLAQLDSESWSGRAEADRDRDFMQLLREKEALLQELILVSKQQHSPETLLQLEEERCRLDEEVQRAHSSQSQGANQRILQQEKRNTLLRQLEEATRITTYLHSQLKSLSASSLTVSSSSSRGSLASSRGSLASSRGSLSSISFSDIYGLPQYERHEVAGEPLDPHLRYLLQPETVSRDCSMFTSDPLSQSKGKRSHDTPQSLASLSSRSSLSSLSPPSSPMDTPYHSAPQDCPLTQMTEEYMEQAGRGLLEGLRAQSQPLGDSERKQRQQKWPEGQESVCRRVRGRSGHRQRCVRSLGQKFMSSEREQQRVYCLFCRSSNRPEESEEMSYMKDVSEPTQIQLGLLYVKVHLIPLDTGRACAFYCCTALEPQSQMSFNEGFRIPVPANALAVCSLQLSVCSLGPQAQEELLGTAQVSLADCEGSAEMAYHWLRVQMLSGAELPRPEQKSARHHRSQEDEQRLRAALLAYGLQVCSLSKSWQAESVDSGCSNSTAFTAPFSEGLCAEGVCITTGGRCEQTVSKLCTVKVEKATMTEGLLPEPVRVRPKERGGRWGHASPFMRGSTIVRSQTFSPGARSQYVCRACRTRQRQLTEELTALRELKLRLEDPQAKDTTEVPHWALRDERFRCLLREAQRQASQSKQEQRQEEAAERRLRKASKEVLQMRGQSQKEPLPVQTFRSAEECMPYSGLCIESTVHAKRRWLFSQDQGSTYLLCQLTMYESLPLYYVT
ncbi:hypothetical protein FQN60_013064 [Etheostoma spectabile]|uniref:WWC1-like helical hairpin domain-containing protein n=1 Tax=Etheostoma spectabile TaxID=54343 RepID=A0A5J5D8C3_9PERO|nr:hypothetical protein FQN60_013064 [Etheostoma spectabile]